MSAISFRASIKIPPEDENKKRGTGCGVNKSKPFTEIVSLRVPNRLWEEKENSIPYISYISNQKRKKKRKKITVLTVPNVEELMGAENLQEEFLSIPIVKRLSLEDLKKVKCMEETIRKKKRRNSNGLKSEQN